MATSKGRRQLLQVEKTCGTLLHELQLIWDEVGESDDDRDKMLLELEQECLNVCRRKVDQASLYRTRLHQTIAEMQAEIAGIASVLKERPPIAHVDRRATLKDQLVVFAPLLEDIRRRRDERLKQFRDVSSQIARINLEVNGSLSSPHATDDEQDLSPRKLEERCGQLKVLQHEKNGRLKKVRQYVNAVNGHCKVMGYDFSKLISEVHPSLLLADSSSSSTSSANQAKSLSNETIRKLADNIQLLREEKRKRMQKLQDLATSLLELWNLMDTSMEEQQLFQHVTCNLAASEDEFTVPGSLSMEVIKKTEHEVERLEKLKASRMKELVFKKQSELEEVCRKAHMILDVNTTLDRTIDNIESGAVDLGELLENIEEQIGRAKEEAFCRKEILDRVEKWTTACEEESWLNGYNKDENRYNATKGAHMNLKRAERARATVAKIPGLVEPLIAKTKSWQEERGKTFMYDGVSLLSTLEEYTFLRNQREEEKRRQRDQRRVPEPAPVAQQEAVHGAKASPNQRAPAKSSTGRLSAPSTPTNRRATQVGSGTNDGLSTPRAHAAAATALLLKPSDPFSVKETRKDRPRSVDQISGNNGNSDGKETTNSGLKNLATVRLHSIDGTRQPLSPVSTPVSRPNKNLGEDLSSKGKSGSGPVVKAGLMKSPISGSQLVSSDEENNTPVQQCSQQAQLPPLPLLPPLAPPPLPMEYYSFEERRLAFHLQNGMQHLNSSTLTGY